MFHICYSLDLQGKKQAREVSDVFKITQLIIEPGRQPVASLLCVTDLCYRFSRVSPTWPTSDISLLQYWMVVIMRVSLNTFHADKNGQLKFLESIKYFNRMYFLSDGEIKSLKQSWEEAKIRSVTKTSLRERGGCVCV